MLKSKQVIAQKITDLIIDNSTHLITPAQVRDILNDLNDSAFNNISDDGENHKIVVPFGLTKSVPSGYQMIHYGKYTVEGDLDVNGEFVTIGNGVVSGSGVVTGSGVII
jgi:hypothetical protein